MCGRECTLSAASPPDTHMRGVNQSLYVTFRSPSQDFLFTFLAATQAVGPEDVLAAAQRHLHPERQAAVVVGDAAVVGPQLESAGWAVRPLQLDMH